ncbi:MAG: sporulation protein SpoOM, partial [Candidatus Acidiferrales bacterium]
MTIRLRQILIILFLTGLSLSAASLARAQAPPAHADILPLSEVKPGMRGTAYTIFAGREAEPFELEVLGVLPNLLGPKQDIILVRLLGEKATYTGVVSGMSGSP